MNAILATLSAQFNYAAPRALTVGGKAYNRNGSLYDNAAGVVRFDFTGRKRRGAIMADKVIVSVSYDAGADLYNIKIEHFDGVTFETKTIKAFDGLYADAFASIGAWVN